MAGGLVHPSIGAVVRWVPRLLSAKNKKKTSHTHHAFRTTFLHTAWHTTPPSRVPRSTPHDTPHTHHPVRIIHHITSRRHNIPPLHAMSILHPSRSTSHHIDTHHR